MDCTDSQLVMAFGDQAEIMLGISAQELGQLKDRDEEAFLDRIDQSRLKTFAFTVGVKENIYNNQSKLTHTVINVQFLNFKSYNEHLLKRIKDLTGN